MEDQELLSRRELRDSIDAEVKRVSELFRFILKYQRHFQPSGVEFSGLREYLPSDDASRIDWKNSATGEELYVKQYEEERNMNVFIIVDVSDTMLFGTAEKLKSEYSAVLASTIAYASVDAGIDVGMAIYGDGQKVFMEPDTGQKQYNAVLDEVVNSDYYGGTFNLETALKDITAKINSNTAIFLISDFIEIEGDWETKLKVAESKFRHVMSVMLRDRRDYELPESGNIRFESMSGDEEIVADTTKIKDKFEEKVAEQEKKIEENIKAKGSGFLKIDTRDSFTAKFSRYFDRRENNW